VSISAADSHPIARADSPSRTVATTPVDSRGRIAALDGLRGIAVLMVVVLHYYVIVPGPEGSRLHDALQHAGSLFFCGVDLFFVLSGFLIGGIVLDNRDSPSLLPAFYARRFFRIVPLYLLLLASFYICREIPGLSQTNRGTYFTSTVPDWSYLCFGQNIAMAMKRDIGPYWLGASWSLAVEEQFYLLAPLALLRFSLRHIVTGCIILIVASPILRTIALVHAQNNLAAIFLLPTHADGLLWGILAAIAVRNPAAMEQLRRSRSLLVTIIVVLVAASAMFAVRQAASDSREMVMMGYSVLSALFALVIVFVITAPQSAMARALGFRPLTAIGLTSYFIYLFHTPIWYAVHWIFLRRPPIHVSWTAGALTCAAFALTLFLSWVSWRCFEAPLLRVGRRFSYR
jgi:peptidoglycan/LPS O-acetylase OafA/YrhL